MGGEDDNPGAEQRNEGARPRERRGLGVFFWIAMVCAAATVTFGAIEGDLLRAGTFLALGLFLALQRTRPQERSTPWRWGYNACAVTFSLLALMLFLRNLGLV